ncbi:hypothetical protein, partial [Burkholderia gladioli]|uniref:hypothetical protein n=1 Tax=Burkholderia gladioli TaxID=28095 RepID=UPI0034DB5B44
SESGGSCSADKRGAEGRWLDGLGRDEREGRAERGWVIGYGSWRAGLARAALRTSTASNDAL